MKFGFSENLKGSFWNWKKILEKKFVSQELEIFFQLQQKNFKIQKYLEQSEEVVSAFQIKKKIEYNFFFNFFNFSILNKKRFFLIIEKILIIFPIFKTIRTKFFIFQFWKFWKNFSSTAETTVRHFFLIIFF